MPFIPHTEQDTASMLSAIGADSLEDLFDEIPARLRSGELTLVPPGRNERDALAEVKRQLDRDPTLTCFAGAGAYEHYIPAAVWDITTRGEFMTAYTPYQAEASQGTLQLLYEYQTMMTRLMAMDVSNASLYDGASALAEAVLMAVRANRKAKDRRILVAGNVHPSYRKVAHDIVRNQNITLEELPYCSDSGTLLADEVEARGQQPYTAIVLAQPNFFGCIEDYDRIVDAAHAAGALVIAVVNPIAMSLLRPPGQWGEQGADIVIGDGQPLGLPLASGGPYFGFMCCRQAIVRQMPGRIIGRTVDLDGKSGYTLTLQAREQHIRRSKATSNICTNQGLAVTAATIFMSLLGDSGLQEMAASSHGNRQKLLSSCTAIDGVEQQFGGPGFHETVLQLPKPAAEVIEAMLDKGILAGIDLGRDFPGMENCLLVCTTEQRSEADIAAYAQALAEVLSC